MTCECPSGAHLLHSTKFDLPISGSSQFATLILPNDITAEDCSLLSEMFAKYAERHIVVADLARGESDQWDKRSVA